MIKTKIKTRLEQKFIVPTKQFNLVAEFVAKNIVIQQYNDETVSKVFSLYFDSPEFYSYQEHKREKTERFKLRFRAYTHNITGDTYGFLELKQKSGKLSFKNRVRLQFADLLELIGGKQAYEFWDKIHDLNSKEHAWTQFQHSAALIEQYNFEPKTIVAYDRVSFEQPQRTHRVTLDTDICFAGTDDIYGVFDFAKKTIRHKNVFILESKCYRYGSPKWFNEFVKKYSIKSTPFSKYVTSIEKLHLQPSRETPETVINTKLIPIFSI